MKPSPTNFSWSKSVLCTPHDKLKFVEPPPNEMFGEERVAQWLQARAQTTPEEIIARLLAWAEGRKLGDDFLEGKMNLAI